MQAKEDLTAWVEALEVDVRCEESDDDREAGLRRWPSQSQQGPADSPEAEGEMSYQAKSAEGHRGTCR